MWLFLEILNLGTRFLTIVANTVFVYNDLVLPNSGHVGISYITYWSVRSDCWENCLFCRTFCIAYNTDISRFYVGLLISINPPYLSSGPITVCFWLTNLSKAITLLTKQWIQRRQAKIAYPPLMFASFLLSIKGYLRHLRSQWDLGKIVKEC